MNLSNSFNYIINLPLDNLDLFNKQTYHLIPPEWKFILMSDGSFTQNLNSLTGQQITTCPTYIKRQYITSKMKTRKVYLQDTSKRNLAFAQSNWILQINNKIYKTFKSNQPIGKSLIKHQIDIHKDIHEIYYVYSTYLEHIFNSTEPIWGRKYTIYHECQPVTTIQEFFSPYIISFF
ncbi:ycf21 (chloroplast) [Gracilaria domingensis]|nr:ycf21 [Gracilaria domingensis]